MEFLITGEKLNHPGFSTRSQHFHDGLTMFPKDIFIGENNYCLVRMPRGVVNAYKVYGVKAAIVANCATETHDPTEMVRYDPFSTDIPYNWSLSNR